MDRGAAGGDNQAEEVNELMHFSLRDFIIRKPSLKKFMSGPNLAETKQ
jgi:hypothetical protein